MHISSFKKSILLISLAAFAFTPSAIAKDKFPYISPKYMEGFNSHDIVKTVQSGNGMFHRHTQYSFTLPPLVSSSDHDMAWAAALRLDEVFDSYIEDTTKIETINIETTDASLVHSLPAVMQEFPNYKNRMVNITWTGDEVKTSQRVTIEFIRKTG